MKSKVAIVTDTCASLSKEMAEEYDISTISHHIIVNGKDYLDKEVDKALFYSWFENPLDRTNHPKTAAASVGAFLEIFKNVGKKSNNILFIAMTSGNSTTYKIALQAKDMMSKESPSTNVEIVDSYSEHGSQMLIVLEAARAASQGKSLSEVVEVANTMVHRVTLFYLLDTLYHLTLGGRTGKADIWENSMLTLKPLLELNVSTGGIPVPLGRFRTKSQGIARIMELLDERVGNKRLHAVITQGNAPDEAEDLKQRIMAKFDCTEMYLTEPSLAPEVHQGPKALRLGFYCE
jgi:DegV family protein with EDD domain